MQWKEGEGMNEINIQEERLNYLLEEFMVDSGRYVNIEIPNDTDEKKNLLRSLMNIRMPRKIPDEVIKVQDEYLSHCAVEKGIVRLTDIPVMRGKLSVWQGEWSTPWSGTPGSGFSRHPPRG